MYFKILNEEKDIKEFTSSFIFLDRHGCSKFSNVLFVVNIYLFCKLLCSGAREKPKKVDSQYKLLHKIWSEIVI